MDFKDWIELGVCLEKFLRDEEYEELTYAQKDIVDKMYELLNLLDNQKFEKEWEDHKANQFIKRLEELYTKHGSWSDVCAHTGLQNCNVCERFSCGDNENPLRNGKS